MSLLTNFQDLANSVKLALDRKADKSEIPVIPELATVATSGSYNDLSNTPTIPTAGTITSDETGYATGGDVFNAIGNIPQIPVGTNAGDILVWNGTVWVAQNQSRLPSAYQEVEYIESTGTQYIDTGYVPKLTTRWELVYKTIAGASDLSCRNGKHGGGDGERFSIGSASINPNSFTDTTNILSVHIGSAYETGVAFNQKVGSSNKTYPYALIKKKVTLDVSDLSYDLNDGEWTGTISATLTFANTNPLYLFARRLTDGTFDGCGTQNIYSHKIWENGTKVQDFVPCYRKADGVIGMYDLVTGTFFTNAGTGTFIKGADV